MTTLLVPHAGTSAFDARHALLPELQEHGVPADIADDALLVLSELVGNAVSHGRPSEGDHIRVSWWVAGGSVHLEVCDGGPGLPGDAGVARLGARSRGDISAVEVPVADESGRGLPIVDLLTARWGTTAPGPTGVVAVYAEIPIGDGPTPLLSRGGRLRGLPSTRPSAPWAERTSRSVASTAAALRRL
jgi:signal transduction histidine kinase